MKIVLTISLFTLLLQCKSPGTNESTVATTDETTTVTNNEQMETSYWKDTTSKAAKAIAGEYELDKYRVVWIDYDRFFNALTAAPKQEEANDNNRLKITLPLPYGETEEFVMHTVEVMAPELAEKYPRIRTYEGRSTTDPTTSVRLDFGENGANFMIIKAGEQIYLEPVTKGQKDFYIIYNKKDVKKPPIDFEKPVR